MTRGAMELLGAALIDPLTMPALGLAQWDLLIRQARSADLLGQLAARCAAQGLMHQIPEQPKRHLESAAIVARRQQCELRREVALIEEALARVGVAVVLLKGAAYAMGGLRSAQGRMMSDVDILVPRETLPQVESALMKRGWVSEAKTGYDQRYYRTWMHELPPMRHVQRGTVLDVHHAILPLTSRHHPSTHDLLAAARPVSEGSAIKLLAPHDLVLHSAAHLFHEGELDRGYRGLIDLDALLREFAQQDDFWPKLVPQALALELARPLFYALRYAQKMLSTPVPESVWTDLLKAPGAPRSPLFMAFMDALFLRALRPVHASTSDRWTPAARGLLYLRGHWLRMPPWLLVGHLARKALMRVRPQSASAPDEPAGPWAA